MKTHKKYLTICLLGLLLGVTQLQAQEVSPYMGGDVKLIKAPNGAVYREEVLKIGSQIVYLEPTTEKLADGVWVIGGYSLANTTVIEADDGLIVYDTGDTKEEAEHIREAIKKISDKPIKVIIYSHSHYAMGAGVLADNPDDVLIIGHPKLNETVESSLKGGGSPSAIPEVGPRMTSRLLVQFNNFMPTEGPDATLVGKLEIGQPIAFLPANKTEIPSQFQGERLQVPNERLFQVAFRILVLESEEFQDIWVFDPFLRCYRIAKLCLRPLSQHGRLIL